MSNRSKIVLTSLIAALIAVMVSLAVLVAWSRPTNVVQWQWCQPDDISYDSYDPYCLSVVEGDINWTFMPLTVMRHYYVFVGRGTQVPSYGHYADYTPTFGAAEARDYLSRASVEWTTEGVTFVEDAGHRLFIPAEMFTAGR